MELEQVKANLLGDARKNAQDVLEQAKKEAERRISQKKKEIEQEVQQAEKKAEQEIEEEKKEQLARAKVEAKMIIANAKADAIDIQLERLYNYIIDNISKEKQYKEFVKKKIEEAKKELKEIKVRADKELKIKDAEPMDEKGVYIESKDGKIVLDYRIRTLFEENKGLLNKKVYDMLYR